MTAQRDRSPSYPIIPLGVALERLTAFYSHFKRSPARSEKVGEAWEIKAKSYANRTAAALYRVIVGGNIGVKEIERLIAKLEMDKEILADDEDDVVPFDSDESPLEEDD